MGGMHCKGVCKQRYNAVPSVGNHANGKKLWPKCSLCSVKIQWTGLWCPCCGVKLSWRTIAKPAIVIGGGKIGRR